MAVFFHMWSEQSSCQQTGVIAFRRGVPARLNWQCRCRDTFLHPHIVAVALSLLPNQRCFRGNRPILLRVSPPSNASMAGTRRCVHRPRRQWCCHGGPSGGKLCSPLGKEKEFAGVCRCYKSMFCRSAPGRRAAAAGRSGIYQRGTDAARVGRAPEAFHRAGRHRRRHPNLPPDAATDSLAFSIDLETPDEREYYAQFAACCKVAKAVKVVTIDHPGGRTGDPLQRRGGAVAGTGGHRRHGRRPHRPAHRIRPHDSGPRHRRGVVRQRQGAGHHARSQLLHLRPAPRRQLRAGDAATSITSASATPARTSSRSASAKDWWNTAAWSIN